MSGVVLPVLDQEFMGLAGLVYRQPFQHIMEYLVRLAGRGLNVTVLWRNSLEPLTEEGRRTARIVIAMASLVAAGSTLLVGKIKG